MTDKIHFEDRVNWRNWLIKNQNKSNEIWLIFFKKHTNKPNVSYNDSIEEAICFGWIDGIKKRLDDERYLYKFTPRKNDSKWSDLNKKRALKMIEEEKMTEEGLKKFYSGKSYDEDFLKKKSDLKAEFPPEYEKRLKENKIAWKFYKNLAPSHKKNYIGWVTTAKKKETRERRFVEALKLLEQKRKLGMK